MEWVWALLGLAFVGAFLALLETLLGKAGLGVRWMWRRTKESFAAPQLAPLTIKRQELANKGYVVVQGWGYDVTRWRGLLGLSPDGKDLEVVTYDIKGQLVFSRIGKTAALIRQATFSRERVGNGKNEDSNIALKFGEEEYLVFHNYVPTDRLSYLNSPASDYAKIAVALHSSLSDRFFFVGGRPAAL